MRRAQWLSAAALSLLVVSCSATKNRAGGSDDGDVAQPDFAEASPVLGPIPVTGFQWFHDPALPKLGDSSASVGALSITSDYVVSDVALDPLGGFAVVGTAGSSDAGETLFLIRYQANGSVDWFRHYPCSGRLLPPPLVSVDERGTTVVTGGFSGQCLFDEFDVTSDLNPTAEQRGAELGGGQFVGVRGVHSTDLYVLPVSYAGDVEAASVVGGPGSQWPTGLVSSDSQTTLFGQFEAKVTLGEREYYSSGGALAADSFVARLGESMQVDQGTHFSVAGTTQAALRPEASGVVLGGAGLPPEAGDEQSASALGWVAAFDAEAEREWLVSWSPAQPPSSVVVDTTGNTYVLVAGIIPTLTAADRPPAVEGSSDPLPAAQGLSLLKLNTQGKLVWRRDARGVVRRGQAVWRDGAVGVVASFEGSLDLGDAGNLSGGMTDHRDILLWQLGDEAGDDDQALALRGSTANDEGIAIRPHPSGGWLSLLWASAPLPGMEPAGAGYLALRFEFR